MPIFLIIICSILALGSSVFFRKMSVDRMHPYQLQIISTFVYISLLPFWISLFKKSNLNFNYDITAIIFAVMCILLSITGSVLFGTALKSSNNAGGLNVLVSINPIITFILSMIFLGEELTIKKFIACILAIAGLILFNI